MNEIITVELHVTNGVRQVMVKDMKRGHTHGYLGAMNTCPSDSKLFGSSASKSATERGKIIQEEHGQSGGELWVPSSCSSEAWRTQEGLYHSNTEVSWEY